MDQHIITIEIAKGCTILLNGEHAATQELRQRHEAVTDPNADLKVKPDSPARYSDVAAVMQVAMDAGLARKFGVLGKTYAVEPTPH